MRISFALLFICLYYWGNGQIQLLNDEFDQRESVANWKNINEEEGWGITQLEWASIDDSISGQFQIAPYTSGWFREYKGALLYKEVTGNFVMTTEVLARNRVDITRPTSRFSLSGIMVRAPQDYSNASQWAPEEQNYIFLACGYGQGSCSGTCQAQLEVKTTENSNSTLNITDIGTNRVQLRVARIDSAVIVLYREIPSGNWVLHRRYNRPDFPDTLQVGFTAYTDWGKVDAVGRAFHNNNTLVPGVPNDPASNVPFTPTLIAEFDFYRLQTFEKPQPLENSDFSNANEVDNNTVLGLLNFPSMAFCPSRFDIIRPTVDMPFVNQRADTISISSIITNQSSTTLSSLSFLALPDFEVAIGATLNVETEGCE